MTLLVILALAAAALLAAGFLYQIFGARRDRRRYAGGGRSIDIGGGRKLYLLEKGSGEGPTVLFEAGIAATNLNWFHIQETVARFAGTASYDRIGLGWSTPSRTPRTPANIAVELHEMLHRAQVKPPYVLVGHSFGGLVVWRYTLMFPEDVASVVMVDPMRCEEWPPMDPSKQAQIDRGKRLSTYAIPIARCGLARLAVTSFFCRTGRLTRGLAGATGAGGKHVLSRVTSEVTKMPREVWPIVASHWSRPAFYAGMRSHVNSVPDTVREMCAAGPIHDIPVLVLTPGKSTPLSEQALSRIGDNVQQVIAEHSAHWIHLDEPDLVIDSIREQIRSAAPEPVAV